MENFIFCAVQDTHEAARDTVPYNNESDKRGANC